MQSLSPKGGVDPGFSERAVRILNETGWDAAPKAVVRVSVLKSQDFEHLFKELSSQVIVCMK